MDRLTEKVVLLLETFAETGMVDRYADGRKTENAIFCEKLARELRSQSLSQEAVRDEALEEAARLVEKRAASLNVVAMSRGEISEADQDAIRFAELRKTDAAPMARYVRLAADAIRALKREPNAAHDPHDELVFDGQGEAAAEPAPAALDVEAFPERPPSSEMVNEWFECEKCGMKYLVGRHSAAEASKEAK